MRLSTTFLLATCLLISTFSPGGHALTKAQYDSVHALLLEFFKGEGIDIIPTVVRLAFHDCVGGCDGCINLKDVPINQGLRLGIDVLEGLYEDYELAGVISRADFWVN